MSKSMEEENKELPEELMIEIALRLPIESIGRFKCVSKHWNGFLSSSEFINSYPQRERIILTAGIYGTPNIVNPSTNTASEVKSLEGQRVVAILGSCNGLVLLESLNTQYESSFILINPITSTTVRLPNSLSRHGDIVTYGLGYNSVEDDYKIVVIVRKLTRVYQNSTLIVKIFSLKTKRCKYLGEFPFWPASYSVSNHGVYLNGRLYFQAFDTIVSFDFLTEKFEKVSPPADLDGSSDGLALIGGCLGMSNDSYARKAIDVWIMEKPGTWRHLTIPDYPPLNKISNNYIVVCRLGEFEFMLAKNKEEMVAYNCETRVWRDLNIHGLPRGFEPDCGPHRSTFTESLVCPRSKV